jgi:hypothetical protein
MNRRIFLAALVLSVPSAGLVASGCSEDQTVSPLDAGTVESSTGAETGVSPALDAGEASTTFKCGDSTGAPERLLLTMNNASTSEVVAFNLAEKKVDGRFAFDGHLGQTSSFGSDPYVVEQGVDRVARMDPKSPWVPLSTWSVVGDDQPDGGDPNAQPIVVVVPDCDRGYVLRFNRNKIAVIDTNTIADGGAAESYIDLSSLLQPGDNDGLVDMTAAQWVPSKKRIYILLGNYDRTTVAAPDYALLCKDTSASIVAIDTATRQLVSLGGSAPGGGIALENYNPVLGTPMAYDPVRDRLLVFQGGCNTDEGGGTAGPMTKRAVEEVDLASGVVRTLVHLDDKGFPGSFDFVDGTHAALTFFFPNQTFLWDPSQTTLGAEIPVALDYVAHDGKGDIVGGRREAIDGGALVEIRSVPFSSGDAGVDAAVQLLGQNPFTTNTGYLGGAEVWPRP